MGDGDKEELDAELRGNNGVRRSDNKKRSHTGVDERVKVESRISVNVDVLGIMVRRDADKVEVESREEVES